jgi:hypothetical protein
MYVSKFKIKIQFQLTLALLKARILFVDHVQLALPTHDLAIGTALLDGCSDFHL